MKIAIISDIHSNLIALQAVLQDIHQRNCDQIVCLGDIVGYGPAPNECVKLIQENVEFCLLGNHDWAVLGFEDLVYFNVFAREAVKWTQSKLQENAQNYLRSLGFMKIVENITYVHSSPREPEAWHYILSKHDARVSFKYFQTQLCFIGHTHVPGAFVQRGNSCSFILEPEFDIREGARYLINVGSVGQPRDFDPRAAYGILDTTRRRYSLIRVQYDIKTTQKDMSDFGLPKYLIERLSYGR